MSRHAKEREKRQNSEIGRERSYRHPVRAARIGGREERKASPLRINAIKLRKLLATKRLASPFGELPRWGAKNVLPLNLIALDIGGMRDW